MFVFVSSAVCWCHLLIVYIFRAILFYKCPNRRHKGKNWSTEEEDLLLKACQPYLPIIECKKSDEVTAVQKTSAWSNIIVSFNASGDRVPFIDYIYSVFIFIPYLKFIYLFVY